MPRFIYTKEQIEFIAVCFNDCSIEETTRLFNFAYGLNKTPKQIKATISNHNIKTKRKRGDLARGRLRKFTQEQREWIEEAYKKHSIKDMVSMFNERFNENKTLDNLRAFIKNHNIQSGRTGHFEPNHKPWNKGKEYHAGGRSSETHFKKGESPACKREVGSERVNIEGYIEIKTAEPNKWELKNRVIWREHYGELPDIVRYRDGNPLNCEINNLVGFTHEEQALINRLGIKEIPVEVESSVRAVIKLKQGIRKAKEGRKRKCII